MAIALERREEAVVKEHQSPSSWRGLLVSGMISDGLWLISLGSLTVSGGPGAPCFVLSRKTLKLPNSEIGKCHPVSVLTDWIWDCLAC